MCSTGRAETPDDYNQDYEDDHDDHEYDDGHEYADDDVLRVMQKHQDNDISSKNSQFEISMPIMINIIISINDKFRYNDGWN